MVTALVNVPGFYVSNGSPPPAIFVVISFVAMTIYLIVKGVAWLQKRSDAKNAARFVLPVGAAGPSKSNNSYSGHITGPTYRSLWQRPTPSGVPDDADVKVAIRPVEDGLQLTPFGARSSQVAPALTLGWNVIAGAHTEAFSSEPSGVGGDTTLVTTIRLKLWLLEPSDNDGEQRTTNITYEGSDGHVLSNTVSSRLRSSAGVLNAPPPPRKVTPAAPQTHPFTPAAALDVKRPEPAAPPRPPVPTPAPDAEPVAVSEPAANATGDEVAVDPFDDVVHVAPAQADFTIVQPTVSAPWPPPQNFQLPNAAPSEPESR